MQGWGQRRPFTALGFVLVGMLASLADQAHGQQQEGSSVGRVRYLLHMSHQEQQGMLVSNCDPAASMPVLGARSTQHWTGFIQNLIAATSVCLHY